VDTWSGHFPITHFVLQALSRKEAQDGIQLSRAERVLLTACQFWAAVARRELTQYLASQCIQRLVVAFEAYSEIGAVRIASALRIAIVHCPDNPSPAWLLRNMVNVEGCLLDTEDPIDQLIAGFAAENFTDHSNDEKPKRPTIDR
jgi:hypothetical protein